MGLLNMGQTMEYILHMARAHNFYIYIYIYIYWALCEIAVSQLTYSHKYAYHDNMIWYGMKSCMASYIHMQYINHICMHIEGVGWGWGWGWGVGGGGGGWGWVGGGGGGGGGGGQTLQWSPTDDVRALVFFTYESKVLFCIQDCHLRHGSQEKAGLMI